MTHTEPVYGQGDASFQAAGGLDGLDTLATHFYRYMDSLPEAKIIRDMHKSDMTVIHDQLKLFLAMWLGGPRLYREKYGPIRLPMVHQHLDIGEAERDAWLLCMSKALTHMDYKDDFKNYLLSQLSFPAERIRQVCQARIEADSRS